MAVNLSTTSSIVDYLATKGQDSSYTARQKLYKDLGLESRLGSYTGSGDQNTNLLNTLRSQSSGSTIQSFTNPQPLVQPQVTPQTFQPSPTTAVNTYNTASQNNPPPITPPQNDLSATMARAQAMIAQTLAEGNKPFAGSSYEKALTGTTTPAAPITTPTTTTTPTSAAEILKTLGLDVGKQPTADELKAQVESNPAYKLYMESLANKTRADSASAEAQKAKLQTQYEADKTKLENNLALNGLAFSGIRSQDVKSLTDSLASSTLAVDRETAARLLDSDVNARAKFLDIATDVIKSASDASNKQYDQAVAQLNKAGFAVIGNELVPIPKNQPASYDEWEAAGKPGTYADWLSRPTRSSLTTETTKSGSLIYSGQMAKEDSTILENSRGPDGYVDPTIYLELYSEWIKAGGLLKDFLTTYPPKSYVNPANTWLPPFLMPPKSSTDNPY